MRCQRRQYSPYHDAPHQAHGLCAGRHATDSGAWRGAKYYRAKRYMPGAAMPGFTLAVHLHVQDIPQAISSYGASAIRINSKSAPVQTSTTSSSNAEPSSFIAKDRNAVRELSSIYLPATHWYQRRRHKPDWSPASRLTRLQRNRQVREPVPSPAPAFLEYQLPQPRSCGQ